MLAPLSPQRGDAFVPRAPSRSEDQLSEPQDVLVIGAGMAGLTAAQELKAAGQRVTILEARDRLGGRIHTDRQQFAQPADLGAMWLHQDEDNPNPLVELAARLGIETIPDVQKNLAYDGAGGDPVKEGEAFTQTREELNETWEESEKDIPLSDLGVTHDKWSRVAADSLGPLDMGAELTEISSKDYGNMTGEGEDRQLPKGMGQLVDALSKGLDIKTGSPVQTVHWGPQGVSVEAAGKTWRARKLLVTASTGVLNSGQIKFDPPLPAWKTESFKNLPMGAFNKILLEFDRNIAPQVEPGTIAHLMHEPGKPIEFVLAPFGSHEVVGLVGGDFARQLEKAGDGPSVDYALDRLEELYGPEVSQHLKHAAVTHWVSDPYSQGSYAHAAPGHYDARADLRKPVDDVLYFAGEACHETFATTVAGAHLSGHDAARAMLG